MRFDPGHESDDLIDRRGQNGGGFGGGGAGMLLGLLPLLGRSKLGLVIVLVLVGLSVAGGLVGLGGDAPTDTGQRAAQTETTGAQDPRHFVGFVLDDNQKTWREIFASRGGRPYENAKLVLFNDRTSTACGAGRAASGPFYCPNDERVYIDLSFYDELARRFGAKGDFAQAYVIAHEIGHHVQHQLGIANKVSPRSKGAESASVRLELQADCFAGIWSRSTEQRKLLDAGDFDEALRAASAIGDDRLQRASSGAVHPESFTHGTADQRARWLRTGFQRGTVEACDTFAADTL